MMTEKLPWLEPGVDVVVFSGGSWTPDVRVTTVKRVNKVTFTVEGFTMKFSVQYGHSVNGHLWTRGLTVVPLNSDEGRGQLEKVEHHKRNRCVHASYDRWSKNPTFAHRQALIDALNAITQDEES